MEVSIYIESRGKALGFGYEVNDEFKAPSEADLYFLMQECLWENFYEYEDELTVLIDDCRKNVLNNGHEALYELIKKKVKAYYSPINIDTTIENGSEDYQIPYDVIDIFIDMITDYIYQMIT